MAVHSEFERVREPACLRGLGNLVRKEKQAWLGTRRAWLNFLLWPLLLGGLVANMLFVPTLTNLASPEDIAAAGGAGVYAIRMGLSVFFEFGTVVVALGAIVLSQDAIIEEKTSGITEWLLSKPVARRSYLLAKMGVYSVFILMFLVILPAIVTYALLSLRGGEFFPPLPFLGALGVMVLHTLFYLFLTLLLGVIFNSRVPLLAIGFASLLGGNVLGGLIQPLLYVTPWILPQTASGLATGLPLPGGLIYPPAFATLLWCLVFALAALGKFENAEL